MDEMDWDACKDWLNEKDLGRWEADVPMSAYTSWKIGGSAALMVWPRTEEDVSSILMYCKANAYPFRILGAGTNLLVADEGIEALVLHTGELRSVSWEAIPQRDGQKDQLDTVQVSAGAGVLIARLAEEAAEQSLHGLEFAAGIPGTFGGAIAMNAGAFGGQISDVLVSVRAMDTEGHINQYPVQELDFRYRMSSFRFSSLLILSGILQLTKGDKTSSRTLMREYMDARRTNQPLDLPSAGSVFRNPAGDGAGRYIDQAGLKGVQAGKAQISAKHANFIVNLGGAKAAEVKALMELAQTEVKRRFGVDLESEIVYWD